MTRKCCIGGCHRLAERAGKCAWHYNAFYREQRRRGEAQAVILRLAQEFDGVTIARASSALGETLPKASARIAGYRRNGLLQREPGSPVRYKLTRKGRLTLACLNGTPADAEDGGVSLAAALGYRLPTGEGIECRFVTGSCSLAV